MLQDLLDTTPRMSYVDRHELLRSMLTTEAFQERRQGQLNKSTTVYIGNLSFFTRETQILEHFSACGHVRDLVVGLNEKTLQPCGFCFVVYEAQEAAVMAVQSLNGSLLDDRRISVSWDVGCDHSRRWGRGASGGQVVDAVRQNLDDGRGGLGVLRRGAVGVSTAVNDGNESNMTYIWVPMRSSRRASKDADRLSRLPRETAEADGATRGGGGRPVRHDMKRRRE